MAEQINCAYCGRDTEITEDTLCQCGVELLLTPSLREQIRSLETTITALRLTLIATVEEFCRRERLRNMKRDGFHVSNVAFWHNVYGRPQWADRGKSAVRSRIDMTQFD